MSDGPRAVVETYRNSRTGDMSPSPPDGAVRIISVSLGDITCGDWEIEVVYEVP